MAWADPVDPHFDLVAGARTAGAAILVVPVRFEPPAAGTVVTVPGPLVPFQRMIQGHRVRPTLEMSSSLDMEVRFQLPATVLPFTVERAKLVAKIAAPSRKVAITGRGANGLVELHAVNSPLDPFRVDIADAAMLRPDDEGGLYLNLTISPSFKGSVAGGEKWTLEYLELEVTGRHR